MGEYPTLGPAFLGQKEFDRQCQDADETADGVLGPAFRKNPAETIPANAGDHVIADPGISLSVDDLKEKLDIDPGLVEPLFNVEKARPDGARKKALTALLFVEQTKRHVDDGLIERIQIAAGIKVKATLESSSSVPVKDLEAFLADIDDAAKVSELRSADSRKTAQAIYVARLEELEG